MKKILLALALAAPLAVFSQWKVASVGNAEVKEGKENIRGAGFYSFDTQAFKQQVMNAPDRFSGEAGKLISIPNAKGEMETFEVWEASNFAPGLQAKFPDIRSYVGIGKDDKQAYLRFSLSPQGIQTMTLRAGKSEFIEPYTVDNNRYIVFDSKTHRQLGKQAFECTTEETSALSNELEDLVGDTNKSGAGVFKTFRLAQSCTGEYGVYFGGTVAGAMAGINATLTRVNGVFEKDFAVNLILIDNNELVVYTDPNTDPYSPPSGMSSWNSQLQNTLNSVIGAANYDIGHLFGRSGGGGNAGCIGCICNNSNKGSGITSPGSGGPEGDNFDIDYVAHEMGHQMGANHTFSFGVEGTGVNVEPGSGSTIMGYAGITSYNVQAHSDDYFTYKSIAQVQNNLQNKPCAVNTDVNNQVPVVSAGANYDIPSGTAFKLTGTATDPDGDVLNYNWEQNDSGTNATTNANSRVSFTKTVGPNFRSNPHLSTPTRYFPRFDYVLNMDVTANEAYWKSKWEAITTVPRNFNFAFTVRDNNPGGPQTATGTMKVNVRNAGPFKVTNITEGQSIDLSSGSMLVEWDVAGTDQSPINTTNVRILFSADNGATFTVVAESTPNDGSEMINFPANTVAGTNARIMIEAIDNVYYCVTRKFNLTGQMGVTDINNQFAVGIYPNPNNGQFYVKAAGVAAGNVKTTLYNTAGQKVFTKNISHQGGNYDQSYSVSLPTGVYMIVIETAKGKTTDKLIIK